MLALPQQWKLVERQLQDVAVRGYCSLAGPSDVLFAACEVVLGPGALQQQSSIQPVGREACNDHESPMFEDD